MWNAFYIFITLILLVLAGLWYASKKLTVNDVMIAYAKDAVDAARKNFQMTLDYSEASIKTLEEIVGRQHDEFAKGVQPDEETLGTYCKVWGAYLGEVMRKHHGGEWTLPVEGLFQGVYTLVIGSIHLSPPSKVRGRIVNGAEDNLEMYYRVVLQKK